MCLLNFSSKKTKFYLFRKLIWQSMLRFTTKTQITHYILDKTMFSHQNISFTLSNFFMLYGKQKKQLYRDTIK